MRNALLTRIAAIGFLGVCASAYAAEPAATPKPTFILKGALVGNDGAPVKGTECKVHKAEGAGYSVEVGEGGVVKNPGATTDDTGRFKFTVPRDFLPNDRKITITCAVANTWTQLTDSNGAAVVLQIDPKVEVLDLEKVLGRIKVE